MSQKDGAGSSVGSPQRAKTVFRSSNEDDELIFSQSDFLTEIDATEGGKRSEPNQNQQNKPRTAGEKSTFSMTNKQQEQLALERQRKNELEQELKALQAKFASSVEAQEAAKQMNQVSEDELAKIRNFRRMQLEMQEQKEREKQLIEEKLRKEEEVLLVETNYQNLHGEMDDMR